MGNSPERFFICSYAELRHSCIDADREKGCRYIREDLPLFWSTKAESFYDQVKTRKERPLMDYLIRNATNADAPAISRTILSALRESNVQDYSADIIKQVAQSFSPPAILHLLSERQVLVATVGSHIVATASLDHDIVRSVFVDPRHQGKGIGRQLMQRLQSLAINADLKRLRVPSSITAEGFYASLGFEKVRDEFHGAERTVIMAKALEQ